MIDGKVFEREYHYFDINMQEWMAPKPFGLSGCFRLRNEEEFMVEAVESFLPWLDEAVLVVQPSDDDTRLRAHDLVMMYPDKVRVELYPHIPTQFNTPDHFNLPANSVRHFVQLSNWALSKCRYSWIAKVEGDVLALSSFARMRKMIEAHPGRHAYYGMVILNLAGKNCDQISMNNPRNHGWDEAVFNNDPRLFHFVRHDKWETVHTGGHTECMGWMLHHMKRCKAKYCSGFGDEHWDTFDRENVRRALALYNSTNQGYPAPDDPLGAEVLYEQTAFSEAQ